MKANPGGQLAPKEVVGRDSLIFSLWDILERQSLVLSAERRMGKTCVLKKMQAEPKEDNLAIYYDLEKVRSPSEFAETVLQDIEEYLSTLRRTAKQTPKLLEQLSGAEVMGVKLPEFVAPDWKKLLTTTIGDLIEYQDNKVILFFDELPYMLGNMGEKEAMSVLDTLRALRQTYSNLRMVFTGSIGLHHVIASFRQAGYNNDPTNDMYTADVPPLSEQSAIDLARLLLEGENISKSNLLETATTIAQAVDNIPFYIHHLVLIFKMRHRKIDTIIDAKKINEIIDDCLINPLNPWKMEHYRERIDNYYQDEQRSYALSMLDIFAFANQPLSFDDLFTHLKTEPETQDKQTARLVLRLLECDYYIIRHANRTYSFRYSLVKHYWNLLRG
jgi:AAA domain